MRRLYQVMNNCSTALTSWLAALIVLSLFEYSTISSDFFNTYFFVVAQLPLYGLVVFGCYALVSIGYHLVVLEDCNDAHKELADQIKLARAELTRKGVKL